MPPQNPRTGYGQQTSGGQQMSAMPNGQALPSVAAPGQGGPSGVHQPGPAASVSSEQWADQVKRIVADTAHQPHQRAVALAELKSRYQQQVLGVKAESRKD